MGILIILILLLLSPLPAHSTQITRYKSFSPKITVSLGGTETRLFGYTSPNSRVDLSSYRVSSFTFSDSDGYFEFGSLQLPSNPSDICLTSIDQDSRPTSPVCIPPPQSIYNTDIGPVILPPTLTIDRNTIKAGSTVTASGQSIPDSTINIYFFQESNKAPVFPKSVQAYSLPRLTITSNSAGLYSFNLPTAYSTNFRVFAATDFLDNTSPKSNTLMFKLPSLFYLFWLENSFLIIMMPLFILTLTVFFYLIHLYLNPDKLPRHYWLTVYPKSLIPLNYTAKHFLKPDPPPLT